MRQKLTNLIFFLITITLASCNSLKQLENEPQENLVENGSKTTKAELKYLLENYEIVFVDDQDRLLLESTTGVKDSLDFLQKNDIDIRLDINDSISPHFTNNLDSLVHLWYVNHNTKTSKNENNEYFSTNKVQPILTDSVYISRLERIPAIMNLSYNKIVKNYIELYTKKRRDRVETMLGLSKYYFPLFEEALDREGLPIELKYLPVIESALNPRALSRAGASGLWQFMYYTGKKYNLEVNSFVDERRDPIKATNAAVKYLKDLYNIYGDWQLVIAAYNCGPGNVNKAIRRSGDRRNYWDIYYYLPRETRGYVPAFIAATYVFNYYKEHNISVTSTNLPVVCDTIILNEQLHFEQISNILNISKTQLRELNPQYRADIIPAKSNGYSLKLPMEYTSQFIDLQDSIFSYKKDYYFNLKDKVVNPKERYQKYAHLPPKNHVKIYYKVKRGDVVGAIALWFHVRTSNLRYWNNIRRNLIRVGQNLVIYVPKNKAEYYRKFNKMSFAQKQATLRTKSSTAKRNSGKESPNYVYHTVRNGENLWSIAKKFPGISNKDIMTLNNISNVRRLKVGQRLKIKRKS